VHNYKISKRRENKYLVSAVSRLLISRPSLHHPQTSIRSLPNSIYINPNHSGPSHYLILGTISLKDNDRQRQSVDLTQVREEYRQQVLERPVVGAHDVESHFNSCSPSSSHGSADSWSSSRVLETPEVFSQSKQIDRQEL